MTDLKHTPGGITGLRNAYYHDEGDGTHAEAQAAHLRAWNTSDLVWSRVAMNGTTGALLVEATLSTGDIQIGAVEIKNATTDDRATVSAAGAVKVDGSAVTQPVSGTFWQATQPVSLATVPAHDVTQATAASLNAQVVGNVASGATDSGNPVKVAGRHNTTKPTLTDGQRGDLQLGTRGAADVTIRTPDGTTGALVVSAGDAQNATSASLRVYGPMGVYNGASVDMARGDTTNGLHVNATKIATGQGRTLLFAAITQGAAGTTQLVAADATKKVKVVSYVVVLDAAGSFKFTDGTADLTGVMPVAANGGVSIAGQPSAHLFETAAVNRALSITTVTGKAFGHIAYFLEA